MKSSKSSVSETPGQTPPNPAGIRITTAEGDLLRARAAASGQSVEEFVRSAIIHGISKLDPLRLLSIPCPFCGKIDMLEIMHWSQERRDGTEYDGDAVRCHRCEAIAPIAAWSKREPAAHGPAKSRTGRLSQANAPE